MKKDKQNQDQELLPGLTDDGRERANQMMALPDKIITSDGRELLVLQWEPSYSRNEGTIRVMMLAVVQKPTEDSPPIHTVKE